MFGRKKQDSAEQHLDNLEGLGRQAFDGWKAEEERARRLQVAVDRGYAALGVRLAMVDDSNPDDPRVFVESLDADDPRGWFEL